MDRSVVQLALDTHDPYDRFGWVQMWRFAVAQYLTDMGEDVPGFRGASDTRQDFEYEELAYEGPSADALWYADKILGRYREWLRAAGRGY